MLQNIGIPGLLMILVVILILFGPSKLPELGRAVGRTLHEFKASARELVDGKDEAEEEKAAEKKAEKKEKGIIEVVK